MDAVAELSWTRVDVELEVPFDISGGSHELARLVVVELTLGDGHSGLGAGLSASSKVDLLPRKRRE